MMKYMKEEINKKKRSCCNKKLSEEKSEKSEDKVGEGVDEQGKRTFRLTGRK